MGCCKSKQPQALPRPVEKQAEEQSEVPPPKESYHAAGSPAVKEDPPQAARKDTQKRAKKNDSLPFPTGPVSHKKKKKDKGQGSPISIEPPERPYDPEEWKDKDIVFKARRTTAHDRDIDVQWVEIEMILRPKINNVSDVREVSLRVDESLTFLDRIETYAKDHNMLKGIFFQSLIAEKGEVHGDKLEGKVENEEILELRSEASKIMSLMRLKIADDGDLEQARVSLEHSRDFFHDLAESYPDAAAQYEILRRLTNAETVKIDSPMPGVVES